MALEVTPRFNTAHPGPPSRVNHSGFKLANPTKFTIVQAPIKSLKLQPMQATLNLCLICMLTLSGTTSARTYLAEHLFFGSVNDNEGLPLSDGSTPIGDGLVATTLDGSYNQQISLWSSGSYGLRYARFNIDLRQKGRISPQGSSYYLPTSGGSLWQSSSGSWTENLGNEGFEVQLALRKIQEGSVPTNGFSPSTAGSPEVINWTLIMPEHNRLGSANAIALGVIWIDTNQDGRIDSSDVIAFKYAVGADTFAEMDSVAELNAAVPQVVTATPTATPVHTAEIPEPNNYPWIVGGLGFVYSLMRRPQR